VNIKLTSASLDNETAPSAQESSKLPDDPDITNPNPHQSQTRLNLCPVVAGTHMIQEGRDTKVSEVPNYEPCARDRVRSPSTANADGACADPLKAVEP
jgi:hypothetical protein